MVKKSNTTNETNEKQLDELYKNFYALSYKLDDKILKIIEDLTEFKKMFEILKNLSEKENNTYLNGLILSKKNMISDFIKSFNLSNILTNGFDVFNIDDSLFILKMKYCLLDLSPKEREIFKKIGIENKTRAKLEASILNKIQTKYNDKNSIFNIATCKIENIEKFEMSAPITTIKEICKNAPKSALIIVNTIINQYNGILKGRKANCLRENIKQEIFSEIESYLRFKNTCQKIKKSE